MEIHRLLMKNTLEKKCPDRVDGKHAGVKHRLYGDGCCTCGKYLLFDEEQPLTGIDHLERDYQEQYNEILIGMKIVTKG